MLYVIMVILGLLIIWWKHKNWTVRSVWLSVSDRMERRGERLRVKKLDEFNIMRILQKKEKKG